MAAKPERRFKVVADNRRARFNYEIGETFEAGIVLTGSEVKSLRAGKATIGESYADTRGGELWLINSNIPEYQQAGRFNHLPKRPRKLLLHRSEIRKLFGLAAVKGNALVPLAFYWKNGKVKVALAVGKGKQQFDKREDLKQRESTRELKRATMHRSKGK